MLPPASIGEVDKVPLKALGADKVLANLCPNETLLATVYEMAAG